MKRKYVFFCITVLIFLFASADSSRPQDRMDWYKDSAFFITIDTYPRSFEAAKSPEYKESIRQLILRTKTTMMYYHCTSQDGYTKYQSKAGIVNPRLDGLDMARI